MHTGLQQILLRMKCLFVLCIYLAACLLLVGAQNCNILTDVEVGNLLPVSLSEGQQDDPMVTVLQTNIVCLVTGTQFGTYQFVSVVVSYNCTGGACPAGKYYHRLSSVAGLATGQLSQLGA